LNNGHGKNFFLQKLFKKKLIPFFNRKVQKKILIIDLRTLKTKMNENKLEQEVMELLHWTPEEVAKSSQEQMEQALQIYKTKRSTSVATSASFASSVNSSLATSATSGVATPKEPIVSIHLQRAKTSDIISNVRNSHDFSPIPPRSSFFQPHAPPFQPQTFQSQNSQSSQELRQESSFQSFQPQAFQPLFQSVATTYTQSTCPISEPFLPQELENSEQSTVGASARTALPDQYEFMQKVEARSAHILLPSKKADINILASIQEIKQHLHEKSQFHQKCYAHLEECDRLLLQQSIDQDKKKVTALMEDAKTHLAKIKYALDQKTQLFQLLEKNNHDLPGMKELQTQLQDLNRSMQALQTLFQ
jgi:hypothetical protein